MWSLTLTDIVQFLIMTVGLVFLLMPLSINDAGGWDALVPSCRPATSTSPRSAGTPSSPTS